MSAAASTSSVNSLSRAESDQATSPDSPSPSPSPPRAEASGSITAVTTPFTWKQTAEEQAAASTAGRLMLVTYNVNSIRTLTRRLQLPSFSSLLSHLNADLVCLQETKVSTLADLPAELIAPEGYDSFWSFDTVNKGRNGVVTYAREGLTVAAREGVGVGQREEGEEGLEAEEEVKAVVGDDWTAEEGRCVTTDHGAFVLFNIYFPNAGRGEERLAYKLRYYAALQRRCEQLTRRGRRVVVVGDVNTAHREIDIHNPKIKQTGFLPVERAWMDGVLLPPASSSSSASSSPAAASPLLVDTWRSFHPGVVQFSFWDQRTLARERNRGWRIDYILASPPLLPLCLHAAMHPEVKGSDHSPVVAYFSPEVRQGVKEAASSAGQVSVEAGSRGMIGREWKPVEKVKAKAKGKVEAGKGQKSISSFFATNAAVVSPDTAAASAPQVGKRKRKASSPERDAASSGSS